MGDSLPCFSLKRISVRDKTLINSSADSIFRTTMIVINEENIKALEKDLVSFIKNLAMFNKQLSFVITNENEGADYWFSFKIKVIDLKVNAKYQEGYGFFGEIKINQTNDDTTQVVTNFVQKTSTKPDSSTPIIRQKKQKGIYKIKNLHQVVQNRVSKFSRMGWY